MICPNCQDNGALECEMIIERVTDRINDPSDPSGFSEISGLVAHCPHCKYEEAIEDDEKNIMDDDD